MFWLRTFFYVLPLAIAFVVVLLFREVSRLQLPGVGEALTTSIREPIGPLDPLTPISGPTREVRDLIFDPLLVRDDDLNLRPHIISSWDSQTVIVIRCFSEEDAGEAEAMILSGEYLDEDMTVLGLNREGSVLTVALEGFAPDFERRLIGEFDPGLLGDYLLVRLRLKHSIQDSLGTFLKSSVEKGQIKMLDFEGDQIANLFVRGDTDLFLRELELYYDSNLSLAPEIEVVGKQSFTSSQELVIRMRSDVKWHDGRPVTSEDLLFSYNELTRPGSSMPLKGTFWFLESVEVINEFSVRGVCRETPAMMMESFEALPLLPAHLLSDQSDEERWMNFADSPVGCGPYRIEKRREDGGIVLRAFEGYFGTKPEQEWNVYRRFDSLESKLLALRSGRVDCLVPDERFSDWSIRNPGRVRQIRCLPRIQYLVAWNLDTEPFDQNSVRTALAKSVDLNAVLVDTATSYQEPVQSLFFPGVPYVSKALPLPLLDLKGAEELLEEAGYQFDENQGARVNEAGVALTLKLSVNESDSEHVRLARALQNQWAAIGVVVEIEEVSWETLLNQRLLTREFEGVLLSWEIPLKKDRYEAFHSRGIEEGGGNLFGLRNQVIDELLINLREEDRPDMISVEAHRLQDEIVNLQPCFFVGQSGRIITIRDGAVEVVRTSKGNESIRSPAGIGKAGLERSRPWWVRSEKVIPMPLAAPERRGE
ncbi:MAG: ABC transporter substrate-binding protein [Verrucomicrobiales bacterium]|nr:ABC transporter substrate-binding protein [Verrucomicrobiales bacterium]